MLPSFFDVEASMSLREILLGKAVVLPLDGNGVNKVGSKTDEGLL